MIAYCVKTMFFLEKEADFAKKKGKGMEGGEGWVGGGEGGE